MTTLIFEELKGVPIEQTIVVSERISFKAIRLYLIKALSPSGTMTLKIKDGSEIVGQGNLTSLEMESGDSNVTALNYTHGFFDFGIDDLVLNEGVYTLELSTSGYTYAPDTYFGWVKEFENRTNNLTGTVTNVTDSPLSFQIWEYK